MSKFRKETNELLVKLQNGNAEYWEEFYLYTYDHLKIIAYKYLYNKSEWKDVVQQTYLNICVYLKTFDDTQDGYNWMCKIARNIAYDFNRRSIPTTELDSASEKLFEDIDRFLPDNSGILHLLSFLSAEEQKLIELRYVDELTYIEIARIYNSKVTTVYMRINKIIAKIKKILKNN